MIQEQAFWFAHLPSRPLAQHSDIFPTAAITTLPIIAPRSALSSPEALPWNGPVTDTGTLVNLSAGADPFSHGLTGVNQQQNWLFVHILVASFFSLMVATLIYQWTHMGNAHLRYIFTMGREAEDYRYWMHNRSHFWPRIKRHLVYAPLFRNRHNKEIQLSRAISIGTLPSRYHTVLVSIYIASNVAYCLVLNYDAEIKDNVGKHSPVIAELRGRAGILAALNLIPTILFALRNNPLIPLLGVSYDTFNLLHRWCARVVVTEGIVHTLCWIKNSIDAGGTRQIRASLATSESYSFGMVATCTFTFMFFAALSPIRHAFYETFLNLHRILAFVALLGVYMHLDRANLPQLPYIQLAFVFWVGEWAWRALRILRLNCSRKHGLTKVTVEALPSEACRVTFELRRSVKFKPGCHVHAYLPAVAWWSSHPFSIAWSETKPLHSRKPMEIDMEEKLGSIAISPQSQYQSSAQTSDHRSWPQPPSQHFARTSAVTESPKMQHYAPPKSTSRGIHTSTYPKNAIETVAELRHQAVPESATLPRDANVTCISLIMRARTGMTRKLYEKACKSEHGRLETWGAIEGPYGGHESLTSYGTVVLFAGGVGITHCVGYVHHLLLQYAAGTTATQRILLVWSVPNTESLEWVRVWMDRILRMEHRRVVLRIHIFVTKPRHRAEVVSNTGSVQMFPGRCSPQLILKKEMQERIGAMGVTVCGPGAFADSVRSAVREVVEDGLVDFVEEAFTY